MSKSLSLTNSKDIICNSISLILGNDIINLQDLFLLRTEAIKDIIGLAPDDLNTLQELSASINNNSDFAETNPRAPDHPGVFSLDVSSVSYLTTTNLSVRAMFPVSQRTMYAPLGRSMGIRTLLLPASRVPALCESTVLPFIV